MQSRTNVHFLVFHLTLAYAIFSFITMPMETIWRVVIEVQSSLTNYLEVQYLGIIIINKLTIVSFITMPMETVRRVVIEVQSSLTNHRLNKVLSWRIHIYENIYKTQKKDTFQWYAGNLACKGLMMVRTGGYILSSLMLIVLSIDDR